MCLYGDGSNDQTDVLNRWKEIRNLLLKVIPYFQTCRVYYSSF